MGEASACSLPGPARETDRIRLTHLTEKGG